MDRYRIHAEAAVYYLTYSVVEWLPVLNGTYFRPKQMACHEIGLVCQNEEGGERCGFCFP